jgi:hypothetical protein
MTKLRYDMGAYSIGEVFEKLQQENTSLKAQRDDLLEVAKALFYWIPLSDSEGYALAKRLEAAIEKAEGRVS